MTIYDVDTLLWAVQQPLKESHTSGRNKLKAFGTVGEHLKYLTFSDTKLHLPCPGPCSQSVQIILKDSIVSELLEA